MTRAVLDRRFPGIEEVLARVRGVIFARVGYGQSGELSELSLMARTDRSPHQVIRDVTSTLRTQFGVQVPDEGIRLALVYQENQPEVGQGRLSLDRITVRTSSGLQKVAVQIGDGSQIAMGWAEGAEGRQGVLRLAATATLEAIGFYLPHLQAFYLDRVVELNLGNRSVVVSSLVLNGAGRQEFFTGIAELRNLAVEGAARATLDAINRRIRFVDYSKESVAKADSRTSL